MLDVIIHKQIDVLEKIMPKWKVLQEEFHDITVFQNIGWIRSWWEYKSKHRNMTPYIIEIRKRNKTIGIIPLYSLRTTIARIPFSILKPIGSELSDYLIPILSKDYCPKKLVRKALEKIYEDRSNWDCIEWGDIPESSVFDSILTSQLLEEYPLIKRERSSVCPYLLLNGNVEQVKQKLNKKLLKEILKKDRNIRKKGDLSYSKVETEAEIESIMHSFFEFHCERWKNTKTPSRFRHKHGREYALQTAKNLFKHNLLHLSYLKHNNEIAAVEFAVSDENKVYLYLTAFNMKFKKYSVGNILLYHLILDSCKNGYEMVDFTRGDESYKQLWGVDNKYNARYLFYNQSIRSLLYRGLIKAYKYKHYQLLMQKLSYFFNHPKWKGMAIFRRLKQQQVERHSWFFGLYFLGEMCSL